MEHYGMPNNMPPVVSPIANAPMPAHVPGPHLNVFEIEQKNVTENIYVYPYAKPHVPVVRPMYNDVAMILVLFILLVIVSRGVSHFHHHFK